MRRGVLLGGVVLLSMGFVVWGFAGSSFATGAAAVGALGAVLLGLAVFARVRRGPARRGVPAIVGTQFLSLALWIGGGLLWAGPPRELPRFASPYGLDLEDIQGRWTRANAQTYELRGHVPVPGTAARATRRTSSHWPSPAPDPGGPGIFLAAGRRSSAPANLPALGPRSDGCGHS